MNNNMRFFRSRSFLLLVCLGAVLAITGKAAADDLPAGVEEKLVTITKKINMFSGDKELGELNPEGEEVDMMVGQIIVKTKREKGQRISDHALYRFNGKTIVRTSKGRQLTMNELLIPCKAKIYFYPNARKAPVLYGIDMTGRFKNSTKRWNSRDVDE